MNQKSKFTKEWIIENSIQTLKGYVDKITVRQLFYRLVALGMTNDLPHYKKVVNSITEARWKGMVRFDAFLDRERGVYGETKADATKLLDKISNGKFQVYAWMEQYRLNRWENQPEYVEVWIEKKALQGVFEYPCDMYDVGLAPCKGYPSLTFLKEASERFNKAIEYDQTPVILYFGDFDPSGEDIPRAIYDNLSRMKCNVKIEKIALNQQQIDKFKLPSAPAKTGDTRTKNWNGDGVVELDAVEPNILSNMVTTTIKEHFNEGYYEDLKERERNEREQYKIALKEYVQGL